MYVKETDVRERKREEERETERDGKKKSMLTDLTSRKINEMRKDE